MNRWYATTPQQSMLPAAAARIPGSSLRFENPKTQTWEAP
jgi:hypothetical protein